MLGLPSGSPQIFRKTYPQIFRNHQLRPAGGGVRFTGKGDLTGEWDGDRIAQVLSNLVRNAVQHGGATDLITLAAEDNGSEVLLEVHNGGPPIPEGVQATMFEPMVRHAGDDHKTTGLGLGLYIASQIVLAHGGSLNVKSTEADGTTFAVRLPRRVSKGGTSSSLPTPGR
jgi:signal transduction histidine kinase